MPILTRKEIVAEIERYDRVIRTLTAKGRSPDSTYFKYHQDQRDTLVKFLRTIDTTDPF